MDKLSVHQRKGSKQAKSKKKPIKVVYISNPMKVKTSASEFRALVQELTGRDSELSDPNKVSNNNGVDSLQTAHDHIHDQAMAVASYDRDLVQEVHGVDHLYRDSNRVSDSSFEPLDDVFTSQMLETFAGFLTSKSTM